MLARRSGRTSPRRSLSGPKRLQHHAQFGTELFALDLPLGSKTTLADELCQRSKAVKQKTGEE